MTDPAEQQFYGHMPKSAAPRLAMLNDVLGAGGPLPVAMNAREEEEFLLAFGTRKQRKQLKALRKQRERDKHR